VVRMPSGPPTVRYITPEALLGIRFGDRPRPSWDVGILCFRGETGSEALARRLGARPVPDKAFYGVRELGRDASVALVAGLVEALGPPRAGTDPAVG
jgi:hypothetical protein